MMFNVIKIDDFLFEAEIDKIKDKQSAAYIKVNRFKNKLDAATLEFKYRSDHVKYEEAKARLQNDRENAISKVEKEKIKENLKKLRDNWQVTKEDYLEKIKKIRNAK